MTAPPDLREVLARVAEIRDSAYVVEKRREETLLTAVDQLAALIGRLASGIVNSHENGCATVALTGEDWGPCDCALADARLVRELLSPERGR